MTENQAAESPSQEAPAAPAKKREQIWFLVRKSDLEGYTSKSAAIKALNEKEDPTAFVPIKGKLKSAAEKVQVTF